MKRQTPVTAVGEPLTRSGKREIVQLAPMKSLRQEQGGLLGPLEVPLGFIGGRGLAEAPADVSDWWLAGNGGHLDAAEFKRVAQTVSGMG